MVLFNWSHETSSQTHSLSISLHTTTHFIYSLSDALGVNSECTLLSLLQVFPILVGTEEGENKQWW